MGAKPPASLQKFKLLPSVSRTIKIEHISEELQRCEQFQSFQCPIYNTLHKVSYEGEDFYIGESHSSAPPDPHSLHYLLSPNVLLIPPFKKLENIKFSQYNTLNEIIFLMKDVATLGASHEIGFGRNRIALSSWDKQWCSFGEKINPLWNYERVAKLEKNEKIYLSPELMKAFSKKKKNPNINLKQSDVFIFAIMMLEIIFEEDIQAKIYNYFDSEIKLKPILEKMALLQQKFPESLYNIFIAMLEFQPEQRISFGSLKQELDKINVNFSCISSPIQSQRQLKTIDCTPPPTKSALSPSVQFSQRKNQQDCRGRSPGVIRKNVHNGEKSSEKISLSPFRNSSGIRNRRNSKFNNLQGEEAGTSNLYKITPNRQKIWEGMENERPSVEPFGLKAERVKAEKSKKPMIQRLRS